MPTFTNQASMTYNGLSVLSNTVTGTLTEDLSMTKTPVLSTYNGTDSVTYMLTITNSGTTDYTNLSVGDTLGRYTVGTTEVVPLTYITGSLTYVLNGVTQATPTITSTNPLVMTGISVPAGQTAVIAYKASTNQYAPLASGSTVTNTATVSGTGIADITDTATITAASAPLLTIDKRMNPSSVDVGDTITYTFVISNTGNTAADASANVIVTDTFDPILSNLTAALNGTTLAGTSYSYSTSTGVFATTAGTITVPAATYTQDATTGVITTTPGTATLTVTGTV